MTDNSTQSIEAKAWHITYWHDYRFELVGITYKVKTIQEALERFYQDESTPSAPCIKYVMAVDEIDYKNLIK